MCVQLLLLFAGVLSTHAQNSQPNCEGDRSVIVHLFNWKHTNIAKECEDWLGPKGYCGIQVSPPNEHALYPNSQPELHHPWWERYQPVSYQLVSRSGNREEFVDMVERCNAVGVKVYGDMVINHMTGSTASGIGSAGSSYDAEILTFPDYDETDFNCCEFNQQGNCELGEKCYTADCNIMDYNNAEEVRDCRLYGLVELAMGVPDTTSTIRAYFEDLINIGVSGFRVDAAKHMWPSDLVDLFDGMTLPDGSVPFFYNEVIDLGEEPIKGDEYFHIGRVTEFKYSDNMFGFRGQWPLANYEDFGESWGMYANGNALVFVDNHDNQRGHGAGGEDVITFWEPKFYKLAVAFALAHPYGFVRLMSSYRWPGGRLGNDGYGPPTNDGYDIKDVTINPDGSCDDGSEHTWICEHRWPSIVNMVEWRNVAGGEDISGSVDHWWTNGNNQIAFSRSGTAFIAFNTEGSDMSVNLQTGMPAGTYCNIIKATADDCTDYQVTVNSDGTANIAITGSDEEPMVAIHTGSGSLIQ